MDPIVTQKLDELIANKKKVTVIADELQVSRQTVYKWLSKYKRDNSEIAKALRERSTLSAHNKIPPQIESVVISIAEKNPEDSVSALIVKLESDYKIVLNSATVFRILKRNNIRYQEASALKEQLVEISQEIVPVTETFASTPQVASFAPSVQTMPLPVLSAEPFPVYTGKDVNTRMFEGLYKLTATALAVLTCVLTVTYGATRFESGAIALKQTILYNELSSPAFASYAHILPIREVVELIGIENRTAPATPTFTFIADSPRFKKSISVFSPRTFSLSKLGTATNSFVKNGPRLSVLSSVPLTNYTNYMFGGGVAQAQNKTSDSFSLDTNFSLLDRFSLALFCGVTSFSGEVKQERCNYSKLVSLTETSTEIVPIPSGSVVVDDGAKDQQGGTEASTSTPSEPSPSSPIYLTRYITQYIGVPGPAGRDGTDGKDGVNGISSSIPEGYGSYIIPSYSSPATSIGVSTISYLRQTTIELPVITGGTATTLSLITPMVQGGVFSGHSLFNDSASFTGSVTINNLTATSSTVTNATTTNLFSTNGTFTNLFATNATTTNAYIDVLTVGSSTAGSLILSGTLNVAGTSTLATTTASSLTATNATTTNLFTQNLSVGNASTTGNQSIDGQFNVSGTSTLGANVFLNGSVVVGTSTNNMFTVNALINSNLTPAQNITYDLGSASFYWRNLYANNINVNSISAASTTISGTSNNDFTLNSDNASSDAESASLIFFRGLTTPNALLRWNATTKRIESNMSFKVQNETPTTGTTTLTVQAGAGQSSTNLFELLTYAGTKLSAFNQSGWLGIGTTTPSTSLHLTTNDGLIIPAGTTAQRPVTTLPGVIRYNTTNTGFEGYNGSTWGSLGGVSDVDQNTYISAENSAGANNDELKFYTAGTLRGIFSPTGNFGIGTSTPGSALTVVGATSLATTTVTGTLTVNGNTNITQGGTLTVGDKVIAPGEIGAGTSSPSGKIAIQSTLADQVAFLIYGTSTQTAPLIDVYDYPGSNQNIFRLSATGTLTTGSIFATSINTTNTTFTNATATNLYSSLLNAVTAAFTTLSTTGTTTLATTGGNVGIGTTTPTYKLDIAGGDLNIATGQAYRINGTIIAQASTTRNNYFFGNSGNLTMTGTGNTASGMGSLYSNTTGNSNTASGMGSLQYNTTGNQNTASGQASLYSNTTGTNNTASGVSSLYFNTTGTGNTASGMNSLAYNTTGYNNTASGMNSLYSNTTGYNNTALGINAGRYLTDGTSAASSTNTSLYLGVDTKALTATDSNSIVIGYNANGLGSNTVVLGNDSIVTTALKGNVGIGISTPTYKLDIAGGDLNIASSSKYRINGAIIAQASTTLNNYFFGNSGNLTMTGNYNTASGLDSLRLNTTGYYNTAYGAGSLYSNTTGYYNAAFGTDSLVFNTTGYYNAAFGVDSLRFNTTGINNTASGQASLYANTTGSDNTAVGRASLYNNTTGSYNTAVGYLAGYDVNTATSTGANTLLGYNTGRGITTGINNTILGANVTGLTAGLSNNIIIADGAGNQRINVGSTGNVGIGTSTPTYKLDIAGGDLNIASSSKYRINGAIIAQASTTLNNYFFGNSGNLTMTGTYNTASGYSSLLSNTTGAYNTASGMYSLYSNTTGNQNTASGQTSLYFNTTGYNNTASGMGSLQSNTTGYNNTALGFQTGYGSGSLLDTRSVIDTQMLFLGMYASRDASVASTTALTNGIAIGYDSKVLASNQVVLGNDSITTTLLKGNVGIGTTSPTSVFTVASSTATSTASIFSVASTTTLFNVLANGNVGIGVSPLDYKLQVGGSVKLGGVITIGRSGGNYDSVGYNFRTTGTSDSYLYDLGDYSSRLEFFQGGFYFKSSGLGTAGNAISYTNTFIVERTGNATLAGTLTQNSDQRLKTNITSLPSSYGLDSILKLNPVTYTWKDTNRGTSTQIGFLAQQVQSFFPELVTRSSATTTDIPDGTLGLNYIDLIAPTIKAIQDLNSVFTATNALNASSTILSYYQGTTTPAVTVGNAGVIGIGNNGVSLGGELLRVSGTVRATGFDIDNASDIAETFPAAEAVDAGTIVAFATSTYAWSPSATSTDSYEMSGVRKAQSDYEAIGIISTQPGIRLGGTTANGVPVAFTGRVPVKVTKENGEIKRGDYITVSKTRAGYGMKLTGEGKAVGVALSDDTGRDTVLVLLQVGNHKLDMQGRNATTTAFLTTGNLDLNANGVAITNIKSLASANGTWSIDENGKIVAKMLCLDEVCIDKSALSSILSSFGQTGSVAGTSTTTVPDTDTATTTEETMVLEDVPVIGIDEIGTATTTEELSTASTTPSTTATTTDPVVTPTPTEPAPTPEPVPTPEPTLEPMPTPVEPTPTTP